MLLLIKMAGLISGIKRLETRRILKKLLLIIMCIIISFALASCSNNTSSENKISSKNNNQIVSEKKTDAVTETSTKPREDTEKKIVKFYVNYSVLKWMLILTKTT